MEWQDALSLDWHEPGFDCTLFHDLRQRLRAHEAPQRLLDTFLTACTARGWITARGPQRTDSTHGLAAIRSLHRVECVLEALHGALNQLRAAASAWVRQHVPLAWDARYGLRAAGARWPTDARNRDALARQSGVDGSQLLDGVWTADNAPSLRALPALEALRQMWLQHYSRCTVPGLEDIRWRTVDAPPPSALLIQSPYDVEARSSSTRAPHWVGYKSHRSETCDDGQPARIPQVLTTPATTQDRVMGPTIQPDVADRALLPGTHWLDSGSGDADLLVTAQRQPQIDVGGPPLGSYSRQRLAGQGDDWQACVIDWEAEHARCPPGQTSVTWTPGRDVSGDPVVRIRLDRATWRVCPTRQACTGATDAPRQLTVRPPAHHEAIQTARQRQETAAFKETYALRSGVEASLSQGTRRFELRQSRSIGLARTHLQQLLNATAMHVVRVSAWLREKSLGERRRKPGHFARLAPHPLSRQAVLC